MLAIALAFTLLFGAAGLLIRELTAPALPGAVEAAPVAAAPGSLLVDARSLAERLDSDSPPVVVDVSPERLYEEGHIPGAIHAWWQDAISPHNFVYGAPLVIASDPAAVRPFAPELEVTPDDTIVVYDNSASERAAWLVWWLRTSGYPNTVVLDGGLAAWIGTGQELSTGPAAPGTSASPDAAWSGATWDAASVIGADEVVERLDDPRLVIIDARSDAERRDTLNDTLPVGQIPGSRSLPTAAVMRPDGTFRSAEESRQILAPLNLGAEDEIVVYGRFSTESARVWMALRLAGYERVRVLDGGWPAWAVMPTRPVEPLP